MTGEILQRLREAYGLSRDELALALGISASAIVQKETKGLSWSHNRWPSARRRESEKWQAFFGAYLTALRKLRGKAASIMSSKPSVPPGATHQIERRGIKEWARIVPMHGTLRGFAWVYSEWVRAEWVEASNEFQAALLATRLPLQRRKTVPVQDAINIYHDILGERWRWRW